MCMILNVTLCMKGGIVRVKHLVHVGEPKV